MREDYARKTVEAQRARVEHARARAQEEDALDAFMESAVLPEVTAKQEEVRAAARLLCACCWHAPMVAVESTFQDAQGTQLRIVPFRRTGICSHILHFRLFICAMQHLTRSHVLHTICELQAKRREAEERRKMLEDLAAGRKTAAAKVLDEEEEPDEVPTLEFEVPQHKVKLIIGAGGERIKQIQRKTHTRIQVQSCLFFWGFTASFAAADGHECNARVFHLQCGTSKVHEQF